jgi:hypothetical protein
MRTLLVSLRRLILGETWTIPIGVCLAVGLALLIRAMLPHGAWQPAGGFALASFVLATLACSLTRS